MSRKTAHASGKEIFSTTNIPFESVPGQSRLFLDFEAGSKSITAFYPNKFRDEREFATEVLENYRIDRNKIADVLLMANSELGTGDEALANAERMRSEHTVAVVTGQQAGLFGGPIYTIYKALSAVKYAEHLCGKGIDAVPIFWVASEDHDFEEIRKTSIFDQNGKLGRIEVQSVERNEFEPVGLTKVPNEIKGVIDRLFEKLEMSQQRGSLESMIRDCYEPGTDFSSAFTRVLSKIFRGYGLLFVSPLNTDIRAISTPIYKRAIESSRQMGQQLKKRGRELEKSGFHQQVLVTDDFFPFFYIDESGRRIALRFSEDSSGVGSTDNKHTFTIEELVAIAGEMPERLSPSALMRPVVQDYVFPTIGYIGGAAEIAYFGQNSAIYKLLDRPICPIHHRASATIIEPKHRRTMRKYEIGLVDLFEGVESVRSRIVEQFLSPETGKRFGSAESTIRSLLKELESELHKVDPTLSESVRKRQGKILWHIDSLRRKYHHAEIRNNDELDRRINALFENLVPKGSLQERSVNILYFLNFFGMEFIDWVYDSIEPNGNGHKILEL